MTNLVKTSDMVSVVRCPDCKYYHFGNSTRQDSIVVWCDKCNRIDVLLKSVADNWFCADGERRDDI